MRKITKKTIKRIKAGYHDDLMDAIELLIDTYYEDKFDSGYKARIEDEAVFAYRLAEHLIKELPILRADPDALSGIIKEYFDNALKEEDGKE